MQSTWRGEKQMNKEGAQQPMDQHCGNPKVIQHTRNLQDIPGLQSQLRESIAFLRRFLTIRKIRGVAQGKGHNGAAIALGLQGLVFILVEPHASFLAVMVHKHGLPLTLCKQPTLSAVTWPLPYLRGVSTDTTLAGAPVIRFASDAQCFFRHLTAITMEEARKKDQ